MAHWRDTGRPVKIFGMDAIVMVPVFIFLLHWAWWTATIAGISILFFMILSLRGVTLQQAGLRARAKIAGRIRPARRPNAGKMRLIRSILGRDYRR